MRSKAIYAFCIAAAASFFGPLPQAIAQDADQPIFPSISVPSAAGSVTTPAGSSNNKDLSLTTHEAAVECATAIMVEQRQTFSNARDAAFKAGLCTGKIQSYMLRMRADNPSCFPKISLEEGIGIFVKWADANLSEGTTDYPQGLEKAFESAVPCLKK